MIIRFWNHSKQHSSKTPDKAVYRDPGVLKPFETAQL